MQPPLQQMVALVERVEAQQLMVFRVVVLVIPEESAQVVMAVTPTSKVRRKVTHWEGVEPKAELI